MSEFNVSNSSTTSITSLFFKDYLLAGTSNALGRTISAPIDKIALVLHRGVKFHWTMFWEGNWKMIGRSFLPNHPGVMSFALKNVMLEGFNNYFPVSSKKLISEQLDNDLDGKEKGKRNVNQVWKLFLSGGLAGAGACGIGLILDQQNNQLRNLKGITLSSAIVYRSIYFGIFDALNERFVGGDEIGMKQVAKKYGIAQLASLSARIISNPIDVVRRRMLMQNEKPTNQWVYKGSFDCLRKIMTEEGLYSCFRYIRFRESIGPAVILTLYDLLNITYQ